MAQNRVNMGQNGSKWPELHWPNPGDPFFPSARWDGTVFRRALHRGGYRARVYGARTRKSMTPVVP